MKQESPKWPVKSVQFRAVKGMSEGMYRAQKTTSAISAQAACTLLLIGTGGGGSCRHGMEDRTMMATPPPPSCLLSSMILKPLSLKLNLLPGLSQVSVNIQISILKFRIIWMRSVWFDCTLRMFQFKMFSVLFLNMSQIELYRLWGYTEFLLFFRTKLGHSP